MEFSLHFYVIIRDLHWPHIEVCYHLISGLPEFAGCTRTKTSFTQPNFLGQISCVQRVLNVNL